MQQNRADGIAPRDGIPPVHRSTVRSSVLALTEMDDLLDS